jgi:hypothetical protein
MGSETWNGIRVLVHERFVSKPSARELTKKSTEKDEEDAADKRKKWLAPANALDRDRIRKF